MSILIVDDEAPARQRLRRMVEDLGEWEVAGEATNGAEALEAIARMTPKIVLMDIRMPGINGVEAARHIARLPDPPAVIFTTAYDEYAIQAFDAQAIGYLMKPVRRERLARALQHAARLTRDQLDALDEEGGGAPRTHICARVGERLELVPLAEVRYFRAEQKYTTVRYKDGEVLIDDSLKSLEDEFATDFVRIHRSTLVAVAHLHALDRDAAGRYTARLRDDSEPLPVSRRYAPALRRRLKGR